MTMSHDKNQDTPHPSRLRLAVRGGLFGAAVMELVLYFYEGQANSVGQFGVSILRAGVLFGLFGFITWIILGNRRERNGN